MTIRTVVPERVSKPHQEPRYVYHLPHGPWDETATWQPITCEPTDGICLPYRKHVPADQVCVACTHAERSEKEQA